MNEEHEESYDDVTRLLAGASAGPGSPENPQMPEHVARRLDDVLAGLVSERDGSSASAADTSTGVSAESPDLHAGPPAESPGDAPTGAPALGLTGPVPPDEVVGVTELASRRRSRWPRVLVAAAAVSVIGLGVGTMLEGGPELASQSDHASAGAGTDSVVTEGSGPSADRPQGARKSAEQPAPEVQTRGNLALADGQNPPRLRTASLTNDVQDVEDSLTPVAMSRGYQDLSRTCVRPRTGPGDEWLPVRLDGEEAVLVLRAPADRRRTADVFTCDDARTPVATTVVDAR